jgi:hypothetical protein
MALPLTGLAACLAARVGDSGPLVRAEALSEGLEFRMLIRAEPGAPALLIDLDLDALEAYFQANPGGVAPGPQDRIQPVAACI